MDESEWLSKKGSVNQIETGEERERERYVRDGEEMLSESGHYF